MLVSGTYASAREPRPMSARTRPRTKGRRFCSRPPCGVAASAPRPLGRTDARRHFRASRSRSASCSLPNIRYISSMSPPIGLVDIPRVCVAPTPGCHDRAATRSPRRSRAASARRTGRPDACIAPVERARLDDRHRRRGGRPQLADARLEPLAQGDPACPLHLPLSRRARSEPEMTVVRLFSPSLEICPKDAPIRCLRRPHGHHRLRDKPAIR